MTKLMSEREPTSLHALISRVGLVDEDARTMLGTCKGDAAYTFVGEVA
jgi:hypothetical protein